MRLPAVLIALVLALPGLGSAQVAKVLRIDGAAMLDHVGQPRRFLGIGEQLQEKAVVTVAKESFVMLEFRDQTRVTLRPNTVFRVEAYADDTPETVTFGLAKGGLRAVSGLVGKRTPEAVRVNSTSAWIGVRGTQFDARLCEQDCESEERAAVLSGRSRALMAARVVEIEGIAVATGATLPSRILTPGAVLYERDSVATASGAYVALAFTDGSRASVASDSVVAIEQYRFDEARPGQNAAQLRLFFGGLRVMTGAIAQRKPESYRIDTGIGQVDPRGTLLDIFCTGACIDPKTNARTEMLRMKEHADRLVAQANAEAGVTQVATSASVLALEPKDGLVVHAVDGVVLVGSGGESAQVPKGATAMFGERGAPVHFSTRTVAYMAQTKAPRPDLVTVASGLFDQQKAPNYEPGLYVWVREGEIALNPYDRTPLAGQPVRVAAAPSGPGTPAVLVPITGGPLIVRAGQAAYITPRFSALLLNVPTFMRLDTTPLPTPSNVPIRMQFFQARDGSTVGACTPP